MANEKKHAVDVELNAFDLSKAGSAVKLRIFRDGERIGTIEVGHGSFGWRGAKGKSFKRIDWSAFAAKVDRLF